MAGEVAPHLSVGVVLCALSVCAGAETGPAGGSGAAGAAAVWRVLGEEGITGGLVVHVGFRTAEMGASFGKRGSFVYHGLSRDPRLVEQVGRELERQGVCGRASVQLLRGERLPYADELARVVIVDDALGLAEAEACRAAAPMAVVFRRGEGGWRASRQAVPGRMDEWTHVDYDAGGTRASRDGLVGPPTHVRWVAGPAGGGDVAAVVASGGRLFTIRRGGEEGCRLIARDACSGIVLWAQQLSGASQQVIATAKLVYVAGRALDAGTGEARFTFDGVPQACTDDVLLVAGRDGRGTRFAVLDGEAGFVRWKRSGVRAAAAGDRVFVAGGLRGEVLTCHSARNGGALWEQKLGRLAGRVGLEKGSAACRGLVCSRRVVAAAMDGATVLLSARDGDLLQAVRLKQACGTLHLVNGWLWYWGSWGTSSQLFSYAGKWVDVGDRVEGDPPKGGGRGPWKLAALDIFSGRAAVRHPVAKAGRGCRPLLTGRYAFDGSLNWVELLGGRQTSMAPGRGIGGQACVAAYGLLYVPHMFVGEGYGWRGALAALESRASAAGGPAGEHGHGHLETGPAYGAVDPSGEAAWEAADALFAESMAKLWQVQVARRASAGPGGPGVEPEAPLGRPLVAGDVVVVAVPGEHRVVGVDARRPTVRWSFIADGPIGGTIVCRGSICVFGSRDGWVYAIRLSDGKLAWRSRVAPDERLIVAAGHVESAWPIQAIRVAKGRVYAAAGRRGALSEGRALACFDIRTGRSVWRPGLAEDPADEGWALLDGAPQGVRGPSQAATTQAASRPAAGAEDSRTALLRILGTMAGQEHGAGRGGEPASRPAGDGANPAGEVSYAVTADGRLVCFRRAPIPIQRDWSLELPAPPAVEP